MNLFKVQIEKVEFPVGLQHEGEGLVTTYRVNPVVVHPVRLPWLLRRDQVALFRFKPGHCHHKS